SYGLGDTLFLTSTHRLGVPAALAIASTYPLWAVIAGMVLFGEPAPASRIAGVAVVVVGTIAVILAGVRRTGGYSDRRAFAQGVLMASATSCLWAINA